MHCFPRYTSDVSFAKHHKSSSFKDLAWNHRQQISLSDLSDESGLVLIEFITAAELSLTCYFEIIHNLIVSASKHTS